MTYEFSYGYKELLEARLYIPVVQICNMGKSDPPNLQEMRSMSWQAIVAGAKGLIYYSLYEYMFLDKIEERWKDVITFTDEIWKYKDVILSIDKIDKIEYTQNYNVTFKQWKYNKYKYIVIINLERSKEIFKIDLLGNYKIHKEFGLGTLKKKEVRLLLILNQ